MGNHRFPGDHKGLRDRRGHLLAQPESVELVEPVGAPALCDACGATPDDPECLCKNCDPATTDEPVTDTAQLDDDGAPPAEVPADPETDKTTSEK